MNKELAFKWAAALESGEYTQGFGMLETYDGANCCIGVLCKVRDLRREDWVTLALPLYEQLPSLGLETKVGTLSFRNRNGSLVSLSGMNDSDFPFSQIADVIRCFYEEL